MLEQLSRTKLRKSAVLERLAPWHFACRRDGRRGRTTHGLHPKAKLLRSRDPAHRRAARQTEARPMSAQVCSRARRRSRCGRCGPRGPGCGLRAERAAILQGRVVQHPVRQGRARNARAPGPASPTRPTAPTPPNRSTRGASASCSSTSPAASATIRKSSRSASPKRGPASAALPRTCAGSSGGSRERASGTASRWSPNTASPAPRNGVQLDTTLNPNPADTMWVLRIPVCLDAACSQSMNMFAAHWYSTGTNKAASYDRQAVQTAAFLQSAGGAAPARSHRRSQRLGRPGEGLR